MQETTQHNTQRHSTAKVSFLSTVFWGTQFVASVLVVLLVLISITPSWAGGGKSVKWLWQTGKPKIPALERRMVETAYWKAPPLPGNISAGLGLSTQSARLPEVNPQLKQVTTPVNSGNLDSRLGSKLSSEDEHRINYFEYDDGMNHKLEISCLFQGFRGISLDTNYIVKLTNLLRHGSITTKSLNNEIWFSVDLSEGMDYAFHFGRGIPVLIALKSRDGGYFAGNGHFIFEEDIPAEQQEVFAYLTHQGQAAWYHVSLTSQGEILAVPLDTYIEIKRSAK